MNCCEQNAPYHGCTQGRDCPVRTSRLSAGAVHAEWRDSQIFTIPEERGEAQVVAETVPKEVGNVWFAEPEPQDQHPLSPGESLLIYSSIVIFSIVSLACIAAGAGFFYQRIFS